MKRSFLTIIIAFFLFSCGTESRDDGMEHAAPEVVKDSLSTIRGEFIYLSDAAVIKGKDFVYGVELDSLALDLAKQVEPLRTDEFKLVPVVVRAKIIDNPRREGWKELVQIREILEISGAKKDTGSTEKIEIDKP